MQNQVIAFLNKHDLSTLANIVPLPYFGRNHNLTFGCNSGFNRHILHIMLCKTKCKRLTLKKNRSERLPATRQRHLSILSLDRHQREA